MFGHKHNYVLDETRTERREGEAIYVFCCNKCGHFKTEIRNTTKEFEVVVE